MAKPVGPTIPRWQLGEELNRLRRAANLTEADVAERLDCSESKIKKIEAGYVGTNRAELGVMLDMYGASEELRVNLLELQRLGRQRGWWSAFGQVPAPFANLLGLEGAATDIKVYEPMVVHGLVQTEAYANALTLTARPGATEEDAERQARLRMERQQRVLGRDDPPALWVVLDEGVIRRQIGGAEVMREQLEHLTQLPSRVTVQVVPFAYGGYPGTVGAFTLFGFEDETHTPVAYAEGQAGNIYMEKAIDLDRCNVAYSHITAAALSPRESVKLISDVARELA